MHDVLVSIDAVLRPKDAIFAAVHSIDASTDGVDRFEATIGRSEDGRFP